MSVTSGRRPPYCCRICPGVAIFKAEFRRHLSAYTQKFSFGFDVNANTCFECILRGP